MSLNYATPLPKDDGSTSMQEFPSPVIALATTNAVANISSIVSFNDNATSIEIMATPLAAAIKWIGVGAAQTSVISSYAASANYDHIIPAGVVRRFVIPRETQGIAGPAPANSIHGLYQRMAVVPIVGAVSSILVTQY